MKVIRTFVAVLIAENLKEEIGRVQEHLKKLAPDVKWVACENLHVTLKFLGDVREDQVPKVCAAVDEAARAHSPFEMRISGLGAFPNPARARVVWTGIEAGYDQMRKLAETVDANLAELGFEREKRAFKSHITIGRVKASRLLGKLAEGIEEVDASNLGAQQVTCVSVMQSELLRGGPVYSPMSVSKLSAGVS